MQQLKRSKKTYYFVVEKTRFNLQRTQLASDGGNFLFRSSQQKETSETYSRRENN
jgi:hypothetical protein